MLMMTVFEPRTSEIGSDRSTIWATTTANSFLCSIYPTLLSVFVLCLQCDQKKNAKCIKKLPKNDFCRKMIKPLQKLPKNVGDLDKLNVAKGFKKLPKVQ